MQKLFIAIGNFFFTYRNRAFPLIIFLLYSLFFPPEEIFESEALERVKDITAVLIAGAGLAVRGTVIGFAYIKRGGLNKKVYAENLVTEGMFALCRNPLYVGNLLIYLGTFLMHGNPVVVISGMAFFTFIYHCIVQAEENYLRNKFGAAYDAYCADVPRWVPQLSRFREATDGMEFNFKRVLFKDYSTMASTFVTLLLTEIYEYLAEPITEHWVYLSVLLLLTVAVGLATLAIRTKKKQAAAH